jgi:mannose-6-phosphate isomerase-like protein (cupin superfamily)
VKIVYRSSINNGKMILDKPGLKGRVIYSKESAHAAVIEIEKDAELPSHRTPVDVFMLVLEGKGVITIGEESYEVSRNDVVDSPKMIPHGIKNTGSETLRVLVVKAPRP